MTTEFAVTARRLTRHEADALSLRLIDYWQDRRQSRWAPTRQDIDPLELKSWLGRIHLWEQLDDGDFRCRLWATEISDLTGSIRDGRRASAMWPSPYGAATLQQYQATMQLKEPTIHHVEMTFRGASWTYARVALPLSASAKSPAMLLNYTSLGDRRAWQRLWSELEEVTDGDWVHGSSAKQ
jgi:hypothetical protein